MERLRQGQTVPQTEGNPLMTRRAKVGLGLMCLGIVTAAGTMIYYVVVGGEYREIRRGITSDVNELIPPAVPEELRVAQEAVDAYIQQMKEDARRGEAGADVQSALAVTDRVDQRVALTRRLESERDLSAASTADSLRVGGGVMGGMMVMLAGAITVAGRIRWS